MGFTLGCIIIAMSVVSVVTGCIYEAGIVALVKPTINGHHLDKLLKQDKKKRLKSVDIRGDEL